MLRCFDLYRGKGIDSDKKGLAFRVLLQDTQKTLTDAGVDSAGRRSATDPGKRARGPSSGNKGKTMTLTKADLADLLFEKVGLNKREAKDMVESFL